MSARTTEYADSHRLDTILLAVAGRDDARVDALVETVRGVASPGETTVVVAHVFDTDSYRDTVEQILGTEDGRIDPDELASRMSVTRTITDRLQRESIECDPRATTGPTGEGIVEIATEVGADRVVIGGRRALPTGKALFGSTAQEVMLNAPCPVTSVRDQD